MVSFGLLDLTLPSPVENLPLDEALLEDQKRTKATRSIGKPNVRLSFLDGSQRAEQEGTGVLSPGSSRRA